MLTDFPDRAAVTGAAPVMTDAVAAAPGPLILAIQKHLAVAGFDPGPIDGIPGRRTTAAIRAFQSSAGLSDDGAPSLCLYQALVRRARVCP